MTSNVLKSGDLIQSSLLDEPAWIALTPLNSWVNSATFQLALQYRYWPSLHQIEVIGNISNGAIANGTAIASGLTPTPATQTTHCGTFIVQGNSAGPTGTPSMTLTTAGALTIFQIPTGTNNLLFHMWFPTDA